MTSHEATGLPLNRVPVRPDDLVGIERPVKTSKRPPIPDVPGLWPIPESHGLGLGRQKLMKVRE